MVMNIYKEFYDLNKRFIQIKKLGWVASLRDGPTGVGYTFESLLNKKENNFRKPDFKNIEIKTIKYLSKRKIHLFNATPEPLLFNSIYTIVKRYGYPDKDYPNYKVFNISINAVDEKQVGNNCLRLFVNRKKRKVYLLVRNIFDRSVDMDYYWSFDYLDRVLREKLTNLAIIWSCYKKEYNHDMFFYTKIDYYKYTNIENFILLIEKGLIEITFKISIFKDKERLGRIHDRGTDFSIYEKNINLLFEKIDLL